MSLSGAGAGALIGLAVGDALGTTLEFRRPEGLPPYPTLVEGPHVQITGGGPFDVVAGQVTDDTQMATCLAASLLSQKTWVAEDVAPRYVAWSEHAFDIGNQTRSSLQRVFRGVDPLLAGRQVWEARERRPAGNGALMRCAPIGVYLAADPRDRLRAAIDDALVTHADYRCVLANAAFCAAIATPDAPAEAARDDLDEATSALRSRWPQDGALIAQARRDLLEDLDLARADDPDLYSDEVHLIQHMGFVRVAFRLAFWHLHHTGDVRAALIDVVNRGGDADTNGAITGALLGAVHGAEAIPETWVRAVLDAKPEPPWDGIYHPRELLRLVA